jgi:hypothetical protein
VYVPVLSIPGNALRWIEHLNSLVQGEGLSQSRIRKRHLRECLTRKCFLHQPAPGLFPVRAGLASELTKGERKRIHNGRDALAFERCPMPGANGSSQDGP